MSSGSCTISWNAGEQRFHQPRRTFSSLPATCFGVGLLCCGMLFTTGCSKLWPIMTPYGAVKGFDSARTLNGLAVHRRMWESAGAHCLTPQKLSPRLDDFDVIVLVGQCYGPPGVAARKWLEDWLSRGTNRTVIYFGRDFNADLYYLQQTLDLLPPEERARGEQAAAEALAGDINLRIRELPENTFCGWFYLDGSQPRRDYATFSGPWSSELQGAKGSWPVGVTLQPPDEKWKLKKPSWLTKPATTTNLVPANRPASVEDKASPVKNSRWAVDELGSADAWDAAFLETATVSELLSAEDGQPLVFRLTDKKFGDGQILVAVNGAPFLNGSLVHPLHRRVGTKIIEQCLPAKRVGLLAYDESGLLITSAPDADARASGLELLLVWPLSAITMPAALLGIIICIVLFPILGRPQSLPRRSVADFGLHIDALGRMLVESRDVEYAKRAIAEYYQDVRGEPPPDWLNSVGGKTTEITPTLPPAESGSLATTVALEASTGPASRAADNVSLP